MKTVFSVEEIRRIESCEFKKRGDSFSLMIDAGVGCAKKIIHYAKKRSIVIVCGPGNNAGDGFIIGNYLHKKNHKVEIFCLNQKYYKGDALKAFRQLKIKPKNISKFKFTKKPILIIDAIFGIGLNRPITGKFKSIIYKINRFNKVISIDKEKLQISCSIKALTPDPFETKINNYEDMVCAANILFRYGAKNVFIKGGHLNNKIVKDIFVSRNEIKIFKNKKISTKNTHGTGCTLSSAIATYFSCGKTLKKSCELGTKYVNNAIRSNLNYGKGHGPINHLSSVLIKKEFR